MKTIISLLLFACGLFYSCQKYNTTSPSQIDEGVVKVGIYYPYEDGKFFDMDYYSKKHMPMAAELFGDALLAISIDKGIANGAPNQELPYVAIGYFYFETMASCQQNMAQHSEKLKADVPNYTDILPVLQISEVQMNQ